MILKSKLFYNALYMSNHLIEGCITVLRLLDTDNLYLVELMETVESADILTIRTGLTAEAGCICSKLLRESIFRKDDITENISHRDLSRRNQIEIIEADIVHLGLLVRKLACTETGSGIDYHRRLDFLVSGRCIAIEEIVDESSLKLRSLSFIYRESSACNLDSEVKIYDIIFLRKLPVRKGIFGEIRLRTAFLYDEIVSRTLSERNEFARHIWEQNKLRFKLFIVLFSLSEEFC